ncbi:MFS transporter [Microlunatus elymi]|uniref:MFS transporter n=1 Tax=Microlunatus elymi TaxID=2596828 RepID=A0A516PZJ6_9ACTN|nr:MFS transporter [Microlunatus elymi]QDP96567.1 MFS transporter [Microlunatus elymi]
MSSAQLQSVSGSALGQRPGYRWLVLTVCWLAFILTSVDRSVWGPAAPSVGSALGVPIAALGIFATTYYIGYVVTNFLGGVASDWVGPRVVLTASIGVAGICMILFGTVQSFAFGLALQGILGFFAGADYSAGAKTITSWFAPKERNLAFGFYITATSLGTVIANLAVPHLIENAGWRPSYFLFGSICIVLAVVIALVLRTGPLEVAPSGTRRLPSLKSLADRDLIFLAIAGFGSLWGTYGFVTWSNTLMIKGSGIDPVDAGLVVALFAITAVIFKPVVGFVSYRAGGRKKLIIVGILAMFAIMLLIFGQLHSFTAFLIAAPFLGFAGYCYSPLQNAMIQDLAAPGTAGSAAGSVNAVWQLGSVVVPTVVGLVYAATSSVYSAFIVLAIGPVVGLLVTLLINEKRYAR